MKTIIRFFCYYFVLGLMAACSFERMDYPSTYSHTSDTSSQIIEYDSDSGIFLQKQDDPFAINNLIKARQTLLEGAGTQTLTKAEYEEVSNTELAVTHHALTVYPKSLKEVAQIESTAGVNVSYYPFNYRILPNNEKGQTKTFCEEYHGEKNPHVFEYKDVRTSHGEIIGDVIEELPVLYVVWPVGKEIPDTLDYKVDYDVSLPTQKINYIHRESIRKSLGITTLTKVEEDPDDSAGYKGLAGYIRCYDSYTLSYVGIGGLSVQAQFGSYIQYSETDINGYFYLLAEIPDYSSFLCVYSKPWYWSVRLNNSSTPVHTSFGYVQDVLGSGVQYNFNLNLYSNPSAPVNDVQRAVDYYYSSYYHDVTPAQFSPGIVIRAYNTSGSNYGETWFSSNADPYINIYNYSTYNTYEMGTTLHELGHITMYKDKGGYTNFFSSIDFLHESFACFVGWHLSESYYSDIGQTILDTFSFINPQKHQNWTSSQGSYGRYSPLYVDLMDSCNQSGYGTSYLNDSISNVPYSVIRQIMILSTTWESCKNLLSTCGGSFYTTSQIDAYTSGIDTWFNNNPSELTSY